MPTLLVTFWTQKKCNFSQKIYIFLKMQVINWISCCWCSHLLESVPSLNLYWDKTSAALDNQQAEFVEEKADPTQFVIYTSLLGQNIAIFPEGSAKYGRSILKDKLLFAYSLSPMLDFNDKLNQLRPPLIYECESASENIQKEVLKKN